MYSHASLLNHDNHHENLNNNVNTTLYKSHTPNFPTPNLPALANKWLALVEITRSFRGSTSRCGEQTTKFCMSVESDEDDVGGEFSRHYGPFIRQHYIYFQFDRRTTYLDPVFEGSNSFDCPIFQILTDLYMLKI